MSKTFCSFYLLAYMLIAFCCAKVYYGTRYFVLLGPSPVTALESLLFFNCYYVILFHVKWHVIMSIKTSAQLSHSLDLQRKEVTTYNAYIGTGGSLSTGSRIVDWRNNFDVTTVGVKGAAFSHRIVGFAYEPGGSACGPLGSGLEFKYWGCTSLYSSVL